MEVVNPNEIGAKISTLIAESKEKFYAVTAFIDLSKWTKILVNLEQAKRRGVSIKFFFREIREADYQVLVQMGIELYKINGLHTKLYFNESEIIVSSMNFYEFSDLFSIDIALHYKDTENYNKLYDYFQKYINSQKSTSTYFSNQSRTDLRTLHMNISDRFKESRITAAQTYLFSKDLVPVFDIFITPIEVTLKFPGKKPSTDKVQELTGKLRQTIKSDFKVNEPSEKYSYCTWDISLKDQPSLEIMNLIFNLRSISY
jgi:hypothetical protein